MRSILAALAPHLTGLPATGTPLPAAQPGALAQVAPLVMGPPPVGAGGGPIIHQPITAVPQTPIMRPPANYQAAQTALMGQFSAAQQGLANQRPPAPNYQQPMRQQPMMPVQTPAMGMHTGLHMGGGVGGPMGMPQAGAPLFNLLRPRGPGGGY